MPIIIFSQIYRIFNLYHYFVGKFIPAVLDEVVIRNFLRVKMIFL